MRDSNDREVGYSRNYGQCVSGGLFAECRHDGNTEVNQTVIESRAKTDYLTIARYTFVRTTASIFPNLNYWNPKTLTGCTPQADWKITTHRRVSTDRREIGLNRYACARVRQKKCQETAGLFPIPTTRSTQTAISPLDKRTRLDRRNNREIFFNLSESLWRRSSFRQHFIYREKLPVFVPIIRFRVKRNSLLLLLARLWLT